MEGVLGRSGDGWRDERKHGTGGQGLTKHAKPVVHGDHDDIAVGGQHTAVEHVACALHVGPAMDEEHHWLLPTVPDVCGVGRETGCHKLPHPHICWKPAPAFGPPPRPISLPPQSAPLFPQSWGVGLGCN